MIPLTNECPYNELIFDTERCVLVVYSKETYMSTIVEPVIDSNGQVKYLTKNGQPVGIKQEKVEGERHYMYEIKDQDDINTFLNMFVDLDNYPELTQGIENAFDEKEDAEREIEPPQFPQASTDEKDKTLEKVE